MYSLELKKHVLILLKDIVFSLGRPLKQPMSIAYRMRKKFKGKRCLPF